MEFDTRIHPRQRPGRDQLWNSRLGIRWVRGVGKLHQTSSSRVLFFDNANERAFGLSKRGILFDIVSETPANMSFQPSG